MIALRGAPASFPMSPKLWPLQKFLVLSEEVQEEAVKYINDNFPDQKFVGIHLRNGIDWVWFMCPGLSFFCVLYYLAVINIDFLKILFVWRLYEIDLLHWWLHLQSSILLTTRFI